MAETITACIDYGTYTLLLLFIGTAMFGMMFIFSMLLAERSRAANFLEYYKRLRNEYPYASPQQLLKIMEEKQ